MIGLRRKKAEPAPELTAEQAQAILDDLTSTPEQIELALATLEPDGEEAFGLWLLGMYRSMVQLWVLILFVEGIAFAVFVWQGMYVYLPLIPWTIGIASFMTGRMYERQKPKKSSV